MRVGDNPDILLFARLNLVTKPRQPITKGIDFIRSDPRGGNSALRLRQIDAPPLRRFQRLGAICRFRLFGILAAGGNQPIRDLFTASFAKKFHDGRMVRRHYRRFTILIFDRSGDNLAADFRSPVFQGSSISIHVTENQMGMLMPLVRVLACLAMRQHNPGTRVIGIKFEAQGMSCGQ